MNMAYKISVVKYRICETCFMYDLERVISFFY